MKLADAREAAAKAAAVDQAAGDDAEVAEHDKAWAGMKPESQKAAVVLGWLNEAMWDNHEHVRQSHSTHSHTPHSLASPLPPRHAARPPCRSSAHCRAPSPIAPGATRVGRARSAARVDVCRVVAGLA